LCYRLAGPLGRGSETPGPDPVSISGPALEFTVPADLLDWLDIVRKRGPSGRPADTQAGGYRPIGESQVKRTLSILAVLALFVAVTAPALAEGEANEVALTGWISDEWCGAKNANKNGADCARNCAKKGAALVLFTDGEMYKLSDKELALEHVGHKVLVTGTLAGDTIEVAKIEEVKEKA
jgi:hypothetical protein